MFSINKIYKNEIEIQKSRFICLLYPFDNIKKLDTILDNIKKEYKGATHYCYAYITTNNQKYSDDGEPSGTAGNPMLNVLKNKNLENILVIVIRYFGGIKLGAGGLVRAYTKAVTTCLETCSIKELKEAIVLEIDVTYENLNNLYKIINENNIKEKVYDENITLTLYIEKIEYNEKKDQLKNICLNITEKESIFI